LRVIWQAIRDFFDEFVTLLFANLTWSLISLPLLSLTWALLGRGMPAPALVLGLLAILPMAPATLALSALAYQVSEGIVISWRGYLSTIRRYARLAWQALGLWHLGLIVIVVDIWFYSGMGNLFGATLTIFWLYMLVLWSALLIYIGPVLVIEEGIGLRQLATRVASMTFGRPLFSFTLLILMALILALSIVLPLLLLLVAPALLALIGVRATRTLYAEAEAAREAAAAQAAGVELKERGRRGQVRPRE
jgi:uncharacterized membrane protein YesL